MSVNNLRELLEDKNEDAMFADGLDEAIIGLGAQYPMAPVVVYDYDRCVGIFMRLNKWSHEEAEEWMEYNVLCSYVGPGTPIFMKREICFDGSGSFLETREAKNDWDVTPYGEQK